MKLQPPGSLLLGAPGAGKTTSLITYLKKGIRLFVVSTEPSGVESLIDEAQKSKVDMNLLHYATCLPTTSGWDAIDAMTRDIGTMDFEALSKKKGIGKEQTRQAAMNFLNILKNFKCERDGKEYGDFTSWGDDTCFAVDGLTGLSTMAWYLTVGYKPTGAPGEWNIAQNWLSALLLKMNSDRSCFFTMTAHVEKEQNEITGVSQIMASTLGRKLAPKIPQFFSEVIYAQRRKDNKFTWSTIDNNVDLKNRALPVSDSLAPDFGPVVEAYQRRKLEAGIKPQPSSSPAAA